MARTKTPIEDLATAVLAFLDAFDQTSTGAGPAIEEHIRENWGVDEREVARKGFRKPTDLDAVGGVHTGPSCFGQAEVKDWRQTQQGPIPPTV